MITHEEIRSMRDQLYRHGIVLMDKVRKMFDAGDLTQSQMDFAADVMKDLSCMDKNLSKACYYDSKHDVDEDKKY